MSAAVMFGIVRVWEVDCELERVSVTDAVIPERLWTSFFVVVDAFTIETASVIDPEPEIVGPPDSVMAPENVGVPVTVPLIAAPLIVGEVKVLFVSV